MRTIPISCEVAVVTFLFVGISCSPSMPPKELLGEFERPEAEFSTVRYWDRDLVSLNERCPNTTARLNPAIEPIYVNGRPIGFC